MASSVGQSQGQDPGLLKALDLKDLTAFGLAAIMGEGGFNLISKGVANGGPMFPVALGGVAALFQGASKVYSEAYLASKTNTAESDVVEAEFGRPASVLTAVAVLLFNILSISTILVFTAKNIVPAASWNQQITLAFALLTAMTGFALQGIQINRQAILSFAAAIVALLVGASSIGLWEGFAGGPPGPMVYPHAVAKTPNLLKSLMYFYFILAGFDDIMKFVAESKDPDRDIPRAFHLSNAIAALLVVGVSYAYLHVLTFKKDSHYHGNNAIALIFESAFGAGVGRSVYWVGVFLMLVTAFVSFLAVTRYLYGLADSIDGRKDKEDSKESEPSTLRRILLSMQDLNTAQVPWKSVLTCFGLGALSIIINHVDILINLSDFSLSVIMVLVSAAVTKMLWKKGETPWVEALTTLGFGGLLSASFFA